MMTRHWPWDTMLLLERRARQLYGLSGRRTNKLVDLCAKKRANFDTPCLEARLRGETITHRSKTSEICWFGFSLAYEPLLHDGGNLDCLLDFFLVSRLWNDEKITRLVGLPLLHISGWSSSRVRISNVTWRCPILARIVLLRLELSTIVSRIGIEPFLCY